MFHLYWYSLFLFGVETQMEIYSKAPAGRWRRRSAAAGERIAIWAYEGT